MYFHMYINFKILLFSKSMYMHVYVHAYAYVTRFRKTDHIVTIDITRNTDLKY